MAKTRSEIWVNMINTFIASQGIISSTSYRSQLGLLFYAVSLEGEDVYNEVINTLYARSLKYSKGSQIDIIAEDYQNDYINISRKDATKAYIPIVRFYGDIGTVIRNVLIQRNATNYRYEQQNKDISYTIDSTGYVDISYIAVATGSEYQADIDTVQEFASSPPTGINRCTNIVKSQDGYDRETDDELKERIRSFWESLARGVAGAVENAAKSVAGVRHASFLSNYPTIGENFLIISDTFGLLQDNLKQAVENVISDYVVAMRILTISQANIANLFVYTTITLKSGYTIDNVKSLYDEAVRNYINTNYSFGSTVTPNDTNIKVTGVNTVVDNALYVAIDPFSITGVSVKTYSYSGEKKGRYNEIPIYYNASSRTIIINDTSYVVSSGGDFIYSIPVGNIASITINVDQTLLPSSDKKDVIKLYNVSKSGLHLKKTMLPIIKYITLVQSKEDIASA